MSRPFQLVDVFGSGAFSGNPLAVIAAAQDLTTDEMQQITRWFNLSETTFLLPPTQPQADYRVRIFTLAHELPFAGHPTLGSAHAWLEAGGTPHNADVIIQECGAGLVPIRRGHGRLTFAAPPLLRSGQPDEADLAFVAEVLRIPRTAIRDAAWVDNGPGWIGILLDSAEAVLAIEPDRNPSRRIDVGIVGPHPDGGDAAFEVRALFSDAHGALIEDPVTGSLNASLGQWLFASGRAQGAYVAAQGTKIGRKGRVYVEQDDSGQVWVGGYSHTLFSGHQT